MQEILLKKKKAGQIELADGLVDVTDPGYDKDAWCRTTDTPVLAGKYNCYAFTCVKGDKYDIGRCFIARIVHKDYDTKEIPHRSWKKLCSIGVDAGMAGFFSHKPDFDDEAWNKVWVKTYENNYAVMHDFCEGFFTSSGYGDGSYDVYAYYRKGKVVALEIRY